MTSLPQMQVSLRPELVPAPWFADSKQLLIDDASYLDPIQGAVGDCYLISAMIALAWSSPALLRSGMASTGFNPPNARTFQWQFHNEAGSELTQVKVSGRIPIAGKKVPRYAKSTSGESWVGLIEKAFVVKVRPARPSNAEPTPADYQLIDRNATPQGACQSLVGGKPDGEILEFEKGRKIFTREGKLGIRSGGMSNAGVMSKPVMAWTKKEHRRHRFDDLGKDRSLAQSRLRRAGRHRGSGQLRTCSASQSARCGDRPRRT